MERIMKKHICLAALLPLLFLATACYDNFLEDYKFSAAYFSSQKPLRTVIADRDMPIKVGVTFGGKRGVDPTDWAQFNLEPQLLEGTGLTLLPADYYVLAHPDKMQVSKADLPIADVEIRFTEAFYSDPFATGLHYALPFKLVKSSADSLLQGMDYSVVAVKYISTYHGFYYVQGQMEVFDAAGELLSQESYQNKDLSRNLVRSLSTLDRTTLVRAGLANFPEAATEKVQITFGQGNTLEVGTAPGGTAITEGSGSYTLSNETPVLSLQYTFIKGGKTYKVVETLTRRQDPYKDLVFEEY